MKRRIFIGIKIGSDLGKEVRSWSEGHAKKINVRWTKDKNLHITLVPPWYEDAEKVIEKLRDLEIKVKPFEISFESIEFGPDPKGPRLIWAKGKKPKEVDYLERYLAEMLKKKAQRKSDFIHLTLARFGKRDFSRFTVKKIEDKVNWKESIDSICLFESKLMCTGSEYKVLKKYKLDS